MARLLASQSTAIVRLTRAVVETVAPEEVDVLEANASRLITETLDEGTHYPRPLEFGPSDIVVFLFPCIFEFLRQIAQTALSELARRYGKDLSELLSRPVAQKTRELSPTLEPKHLDAFANAMLAQMISRGVSQKLAKDASDCLVRTIVASPELLEGIVRR